MDPTIETLSHIAQIAALAVAGLWAGLWALRYRLSKNWVQFDISARLWRLNSPVKAEGRVWRKRKEDSAVGGREKTWGGEWESTKFTLDAAAYTIEFVLRFTNRGRTRAKLYNIRVMAKSLREGPIAILDEKQCHLKLDTIFASGNVVPEMKVKRKFLGTERKVAKTSYLYIEPGVSQTVTFLTLIPEPHEVLQIIGEYSLKQRRIFPEQTRTPISLYPHRSARTYKFTDDGILLTGGAVESSCAV